MTNGQPAASGQSGFMRENERSDQLLADQELAADVAAAHADAEEMDRVYPMNLAMIRKAAQMTQVEVARKLGVGQGVVSRLEHRDDMLLSTLYDYLMATGAEGASIVVIVHGHRIELDLSGLRNPPEQQSALASPSPMPRDTALRRAHIAAYGRDQECIRSVTLRDHGVPSAWNVPWNGTLHDPSAVSAVSAMTCAS
jgi:transcriptional regulator with XRE-family HTH domain